MIIIGLTGGIGVGKSFVAAEFKKKGIPIYNSDERAKELMSTHSSIVKQLITKFGDKVFINKQLNRKLISDQIFTNKSLIEWINQLVHPEVQKDFIQWVNLQNAPFVIKEAAILIESEAYKQCNKVIVVTSPKELQIKRVMLRDNMTHNQVQARIDNQITDYERNKYADYTIINDGIMVVSTQINEIYNSILELK